MSRQSVGIVDFQDLRLNTGCQFGITRIPQDNMTLIFLDQDVEGKGVMGAGDLEVGLYRENTKRLLVLVQKAKSIIPTKNSSWQTVGEAEFSWSDHADKSETGEDYGRILIESNGSATRMVFQTRKWDWVGYVATFSSVVLDQFSALISRALCDS